MNKIRNHEIIQQVGRRIRQLRMEKGLSQRILAYKADIPINQVGRIERAEINPSVSTLYAICVVIEISLSDFFDYKAG